MIKKSLHIILLAIIIPVTSKAIDECELYNLALSNIILDYGIQDPNCVGVCDTVITIDKWLCGDVNNYCNSNCCVCKRKEMLPKETFNSCLRMIHEQHLNDAISYMIFFSIIQDNVVYADVFNGLKRKKWVRDPYNYNQMSMFGDAKRYCIKFTESGAISEIKSITVQFN